MAGDSALPSDPPQSVGGSVLGSTILVADDERLARESLAALLRASGYQVETFDDGQSLVERVGRGDVDLVLLDVVMPRMSGLEACRIIKGIARDTFLPVVLLTVRSDTQSRVDGLRLGADDYLGKPFDSRELLARVEAMLRIKKLHDHVVKARAKLEKLSVHDELTGLYNYRYLHTRLSEEFKRAERYHDPLACVMLDVDGLQEMNERSGRGLGDNILTGLADVLRRNVREVDVVARFGGDEFLLVLPSTHFAGSVTVAERIWREVTERAFFGEEGGPVRITLSVGVALYPSRDVRSKDSLLRAADTAVHQAKRDGGNRICVFQQHGYLYTPVVGPAPGEERAPRSARPEARGGSQPPPSTRSPAGRAPSVSPSRGQSERPPPALPGRSSSAPPRTTPPGRASSERPPSSRRR